MDEDLLEPRFTRRICKPPLNPSNFTFGPTRMASLFRSWHRVLSRCHCHLACLYFTETCWTLLMRLFEINHKMVVIFVSIYHISYQYLILILSKFMTVVFVSKWSWFSACRWHTQTAISEKCLRSTLFTNSEASVEAFEQGLLEKEQIFWQLGNTRSLK